MEEQERSQQYKHEYVNVMHEYGSSYWEFTSLPQVCSLDQNKLPRSTYSCSPSHKVYCGKNNSKRRKRGLGETAFVITFDIDVEDRNPAADEAVEKAKLQAVASDLDKREPEISRAAKQAAATVISVSQDHVDVEEGNATISCPRGKVVVVKQGAGSDIVRSECGELRITPWRSFIVRLTLSNNVEFAEFTMP